jgi:hypothetical protein
MRHTRYPHLEKIADLLAILSVTISYAVKSHFRVDEYTVLIDLQLAVHLHAGKSRVTHLRDQLVARQMRHVGLLLGSQRGQTHVLVQLSGWFARRWLWLVLHQLVSVHHERLREVPSTLSEPIIGFGNDGQFHRRFRGALSDADMRLAAAIE